MCVCYTFVMINVVLFNPEIPPNTGSIARQCVGMNARLHLVKPIGFDISEKAVKRAGLDHWADLDLVVHENAEEFLLWLGDRVPWLITKFGHQRYDVPEYSDEDVLIFGNEVRGLPESWLNKWSKNTVYLPVLGKVRSYNLAKTVSIVLAEANLRAGLYDGVEGMAQE